MTDEFKTIAVTSEGYYTEKRSKFLAFAHPVRTVDEIKELLAGYRKKYYDARHVCYATTEVSTWAPADSSLPIARLLLTHWPMPP